MIAAVYFYINNITYKGPFDLMRHCSTHRPFCKEKYGWLNGLIPRVIAPFFGQMPFTYRAHHVGMHLAENNLALDESSTMPYQRDSVRGLSPYFLTFFTGIYTLTAYFFMRKRKRPMYRTVQGELLFILMCTGLCVVNWQATLMVFMLPLVAFRLVVMARNWTQHAYVSADEPPPFQNSITCINVKFKHK